MSGAPDLLRAASSEVDADGGGAGLQPLEDEKPQSLGIVVIPPVPVSGERLELASANASAAITPAAAATAQATPFTAAPTTPMTGGNAPASMTSTGAASPMHHSPEHEAVHSLLDEHLRAAAVKHKRELFRSSPNRLIPKPVHAAAVLLPSPTSLHHAVTGTAAPHTVRTGTRQKAAAAAATPQPHQPHTASTASASAGVSGGVSGSGGGVIHAPKSFSFAGAAVAAAYHHSPPHSASPHSQSHSHTGGGWTRRPLHDPRTGSVDVTHPIHTATVLQHVQQLYQSGPTRAPVPATPAAAATPAPVPSPPPQPAAVAVRPKSIFDDDENDDPNHSSSPNKKSAKAKRVPAGAPPPPQPLHTGGGSVLHPHHTRLASNPYGLDTTHNLDNLSVLKWAHEYELDAHTLELWMKEHRHRTTSWHSLHTHAGPMTDQELAEALAAERRARRASLTNLNAAAARRAAGDDTPPSPLSPNSAAAAAAASAIQRAADEARMAEALKRRRAERGRFDSPTRAFASKLKAKIVAGDSASKAPVWRSNNTAHSKYTEYTDGDGNTYTIDPYAGRSKSGSNATTPGRATPTGTGGSTPLRRSGSMNALRSGFDSGGDSPLAALGARPQTASAAAATAQRIKAEKSKKKAAVLEPSQSDGNSSPKSGYSVPHHRKSLSPVRSNPTLTIGAVDKSKGKHQTEIIQTKVEDTIESRHKIGDSKRRPKTGKAASGKSGGSGDDDDEEAGEDRSSLPAWGSRPPPAPLSVDVSGTSFSSVQPQKKKDRYAHVKSKINSKRSPADAAARDGGAAVSDDDFNDQLNAAAADTGRGSGGGEESKTGTDSGTGPRRGSVTGAEDLILVAASPKSGAPATGSGGPKRAASAATGASGAPETSLERYRRMQRSHRERVHDAVKNKATGKAVAMSRVTELTSHGGKQLIRPADGDDSDDEPTESARRTRDEQKLQIGSGGSGGGGPLSERSASGSPRSLLRPKTKQMTGSQRPGTSGSSRALNSSSRAIARDGRPQTAAANTGARDRSLFANRTGPAGTDAGSPDGAPAPDGVEPVATPLLAFTRPLTAGPTIARGKPTPEMIRSASASTLFNTSSSSRAAVDAAPEEYRPYGGIDIDSDLSVFGASALAPGERMAELNRRRPMTAAEPVNGSSSAGGRSTTYGALSPELAPAGSATGRTGVSLTPSASLKVLTGPNAPPLSLLRSASAKVITPMKTWQPPAPSPLDPMIEPPHAETARGASAGGDGSAVQAAVGVPVSGGDPVTVPLPTRLHDQSLRHLRMKSAGARRSDGSKPFYFNQFSNYRDASDRQRIVHADSLQRVLHPEWFRTDHATGDVVGGAVVRPRTAGTAASANDQLAPFKPPPKTAVQSAPVPAAESPVAAPASEESSAFYRFAISTLCHPALSAPVKIGGASKPASALVSPREAITSVAISTHASPFPT